MQQSMGSLLDDVFRSAVITTSPRLQQEGSVLVLRRPLRRPGVVGLDATSANMTIPNKEEAFATRRKAYLEQDFDPGYYPSSVPFDIRLALAVEYAAYQLGQINRKLDRLIEAEEQIARGRSRGPK